jgi:hypothetical protein
MWPFSAETVISFHPRSKDKGLFVLKRGREVI